MAKITRNPKAAGGTQYQTGKSLIRSTEVDDDFDQIYTELDAGIDDANMRAAADVASSKIGDYSGAAGATMGTRTDPGNASDSGASLVPATTLNGEIERLRFAIERASVGLAARRKTGTDDVSWYDKPARSQNLIQNGAFAIDDDTAAASAAPPGWVLVGAPTIALNTETEAGDGNTLLVTGAGAVNSGISQTLAGLKPSTRYLVYALAKVAVASDILTISSSGADATSDFSDLDYDVTDATHSTMAPAAAIFETDSTPASVTVSFLAAAVGDIFELAHVGVYECNTNPYHGPGRYVFRQASSTEDAGGFVAASWAELTTDGGTTSFSLSVNPPQGATVRASAKVVGLMETGAGVVGLRLKEDGTVKDASFDDVAGAGDLFTLSVQHLADSGTEGLPPAPGTALTYTIEGGCTANTAQLNDTVNSQASFSWLEVELIVP